MQEPALAQIYLDLGENHQNRLTISVQSLRQEFLSALTGYAVWGLLHVRHAWYR